MRLITLPQLASLSLAWSTCALAASISLSTDSRSLLSGSNDLILKRDDSTGGCASVGLSSDYTPCGQGLPPNFCCDTASKFTCKAFNNAQSAICCPPGQDCNVFAQVPCNPQGLNVTAPSSAGANLHSTLIVGGLIICSDKCCPVGYACSTDSSNTCVLLNSTSSSGASTPTASSPAATLSNVPASSSNNPNGAVTDDSQCAAYPITAVLVGLFPGIVAGLIAAIALTMCFSSYRRRGNHNDGTESRASLTRNPAHGPVSEPIFHDTGATRVDFLRRMSRRRGSNAHSNGPNGSANGDGSTTFAQSTPSQRSAKVRGLFSPSSSANATPRSGNAARTPRTPLRRQSSTESIVIFSPPETRFGSDVGGGVVGTGGAMGHGSLALAPPMTATTAGTRDTRWEDVMAGAKGLGVKGLAAPPAFLGSPSIVDGRRKALDGSARIR